MSEKDLVSYFETSDEFITILSSTSKQVKQYQQEKDFIEKLVSGDPESGKQGLYSGEIKKNEIVSAMVKADLIKDPSSCWSKFQVKRNLKRIHQTNYWKGYSFVKLTEGDYDHTLYKVRRDDVSGLPPF